MACQFMDVKPSPPVCCLENDINNVQINALQGVIRELEFTHGIWVECSKISLEYHLLSKGIVKMRHRHRTEKFRCYLKKVERGLKKLSCYNLPSVLQRMISLCPKDLDDIEGSTLRLPSRQLFFYLMHRMHKAAQMIKYLMDNCMNAYTDLSQKVKIGMFVAFYMLHMSNAAGVWFILRAYLKSLQHLYALLSEFALCVKATSVPWVNEILPVNLDNILFDTRPAEIPTPSPATERLMVKVEARTKEEDSAENFTGRNLSSALKVEEDLGTTISKEDLKKITRKRKKKEKGKEGGKKRKLDDQGVTRQLVKKKENYVKKIKKKNVFMK